MRLPLPGRIDFVLFLRIRFRYSERLMPNVISRIAEQLPQATLPSGLQQAGQALQHLVETDAYVGEVVSLGYNDAIVQIHDYHRKQVGGIPALCFLIGTRVSTSETADRSEE